MREDHFAVPATPGRERLHPACDDDFGVRRIDIQLFSANPNDCQFVQLPFLWVESMHETMGADPGRGFVK
jgi:hypothetical protein